MEEIQAFPTPRRATVIAFSDRIITNIMFSTLVLLTETADSKIHPIIWARAVYSCIQASPFAFGTMEV